MAATKKSAKRSAKKRTSAKKKGAGKPSRSKTKKASRNRTTALGSVLKAGGKTWRTLKNTTARVVEGVKESIVGEDETETRWPRRRS